MKSKLILFAGVIASAFTACTTLNSGIKQALADPASAKLAKPTAGQIKWADIEMEMFVCLDPCSWQGREYDNHSTPLNQMALPKLDVEQWCKAAKSFGAKQLLLVCKHTGGFCWWPTETTDYCVKNISWKGGKGNLVKELADAIHRNGLKMGIYIYSDDPTYTKGIGRGGRTDDPKKQEEWNAKLRQQWTEVLTICGSELVGEVWFDGGCIVPLKDIIDKLAPNAQIFAGPHETIRWPGTESGKLPYPCWSTVPADLRSASGGDMVGVGDPDGSRWCPPECDTVLYGHGGHNWFWSQENESHRRSLDELMEVYLKSVGRGGVLLLNSTPNTNGVIPDGDMKTYKAFGEEIRRRFGSPLAKTQGVGTALELNLGKLKKVNQAWIMEDLRGGHRIRAYVLEGHTADDTWQQLATGISVGHKRIEEFTEVTVDRLRLRIIQNVGTPIIRELAAFYADGVKAGLATAAKLGASDKSCGQWSDGVLRATFDLTPHIKMPATYAIKLKTVSGKVNIRSAKLMFNGTEMPAQDCTFKDEMIIIRQTQQITKQTKTEVVVEFAPGTQAGEAKIRMVSEK